MSAEADIYPNKNLRIRHQNRPVVVLVVNFQIFNLFGGAGGLAPLLGVRCVETAGLFWLLFWSQKSNATPKMPSARPDAVGPSTRNPPFFNIYCSPR